MHELWVIFGIAVLAAAVADIFLTVLNYDESGFLATRLCRLQWYCLRSVTRRLSRRWRPLVLRQVTGLNVALSVATWLGGIVVGFAFIYYGLMVGTNFQYDGRGVGAGMFSALYLSAAQLSTVGTSQVNAQTDILRTLTIAETLSSPLLITLILTFLIGVYQVIRDLRTLSSIFSNAEQGIGDLMLNLEPYFPNGQPTGLDGYLQSIDDNFWSYADGLRMHHIAYFFQSGRDQFSLPYVLNMFGKTLAALRWGLPSDNSVTKEPLLPRLSSQYERVADYLHDQLKWASSDVPETVSFEEFSAAHAGAAETTDIWVGRFLLLTRDMARLARLAPTDDLEDLYSRYRQWLPFAYRAEQVTSAVSRDLDYQPLGSAGELWQTRPEDNPRAEKLPDASPPMSLWRRIVNRCMAVPDPGFARLVKATAATLATAATVGALYVICSVTHMPAMPSTMFGGMIAMYAATMPSDATKKARKLTTLLAVVPAIGAAALSTVLPRSFVVNTVALVVVVLLAVAAGGMGRRFAALGQLTFMSFYFGMALHFQPEQLPSIALATVVGVSFAFLFRFVLIVERPDRVLRSGLDVFHTQLTLFLDPLIDAVSGARWDPDIRKRVRTHMAQLHRCAAFLQGQLRARTTSSAAQGTAGLPLLLFDTELAANQVTALARQAACSGTMVPLALRGQLAGILEQAQERLGHLAMPAGRERALLDEPPQRWPKLARRLHKAVREFLRAAGALHDAQTTALATPGMAARSASSLTPGPTANTERSGHASKPEQRDTGLRGLRPLTATGRQAIQAAVATGIALIAGATVSSSNQYWAALAAFLVLGGTETVEETRLKGMQRTAGTVGGALLGFGVTIYIGTDPIVILPLLIFCVFASIYFRPVSYALTTFWTTMALALLYDFLGTLTTETLGIRVAETAIGAAIALAAATLLLPIRTNQKLKGDVLAFILTLDDIVRSCLKRLAGGADAPSLAAQELTLNAQLRRMNASAEPLRHTTGSLRLDGIERRITAATALTYYARRLIKATETFIPEVEPSATSQYPQLATFTRENFAALIQVLNGELPGAIHEGKELAMQPEAATNQPESPSSEAAHFLLRINQTVLTLIDEITRDTATHAQAAVQDSTISGSDDDVREYREQQRAKPLLDG